jgi:glutamyl-Q tRNA(Asp) synthetase
LQQELGFLPFRYAHVPVVTTAQGEKLAKGSGATALDPSRAGEWLARGLAFLGQSPPADLAGRPLPSIWDWARSNWSLERVPRERAIPWSP